MSALSEPQLNQQDTRLESLGAQQQQQQEDEKEQLQQDAYLKDIIYLTILRQKIDGSVFDADFSNESEQQQQQLQQKQLAKLTLDRPESEKRLPIEKPAAPPQPQRQLQLQQPAAAAVEVCTIRVHIPELKSEIEIECRPRDSFWHLKLCLIDALLAPDATSPFALPEHLATSGCGSLPESGGRGLRSSLVSQLLSSRGAGASLGRHSLAARARNVISRRLSQAAPRCRSSGGSLSSADASSCSTLAAAGVAGKSRRQRPGDSIASRRSLNSSAFYYGFSSYHLAGTTGASLYPAAGNSLSNDEAAAVKALVLATGASDYDEYDEFDRHTEENHYDDHNEDHFYHTNHNHHHHTDSNSEQYDEFEHDEHPYATLTNSNSQSSAATTTCSSERRLSTLLIGSCGSDAIGLVDDDECSNLPPVSAATVELTPCEQQAGSRSLFEQALASGYLNHGFYSFSLARFLDDQTPLTDYLSLVSSPSGTSYYLDLEFKVKQRQSSASSSLHVAPPTSGRSLLNAVINNNNNNNINNTPSIVQRLSLAANSSSGSLFHLSAPHDRRQLHQVVNANDHHYNQTTTTTTTGDSMIARLAAGSAAGSTSGQVRRQSAQPAGSAAAGATGVATSSQSKRKRAKLLEVLLNSNWSKQSQQASNLLKLNKILLACDANFLDEKSGQSPVSLAISSMQINGSTNQHQWSAAASSESAAQAAALLQATTSCSITACSQSASLFNLQCAQSTATLGANNNHHQLAAAAAAAASNTISSHQQQQQLLLLQQTNIVDLIHSRAPLIERILLLLVKSGALIDFRNCDGRTPLHMAAMKSNFWALKTLLELGASTDYRDINGLTPLYYSILHKADLKVTQLLLNYRKNPSPLDGGGGGRQMNSSSSSNNNNLGIGITDQHNWQEVHQACKLGLDAHLEKLLYYGCDINAKISGSGNTPLHVAAINDQLNCAKVLLMRGADKTITNSSHQTAHQVAVVSNNMDLAEFIAEHTDSKVIPFNERPANYLNLAALQSGAPTSANGADVSANNSQSLQLQQQQQQQQLNQRSATAAVAPLNSFGLSSQVQQHHMNPLSLDVPAPGGGGCDSSARSSSNSTGGSSSQPQSLLSIASNHHNNQNHNHHQQQLQQHHNHHQQLHNHQLNNISPCLSQRSFATSNTTSSSGVCCDGDGNNSAEEAHSHQTTNRQAVPNSLSHHSNVTIIAINNDKTTARSQPQSGQEVNGSQQVRSDLEEDCSRSSSSSGSSSTNDGLCSLMSEERPLYVGTVVEASSEYQSGDPNHLQLRRGDRVQVLEYTAELLMAGPVPRLANKPMLYGRRLSDNSTGLFPSICVQRAKHTRSSHQVTAITSQQQQAPTQQRQPLALVNSNCQQLPARQLQTNQPAPFSIRGTDLPESQSMAALFDKSALLPAPPKPLDSDWQVKSNKSSSFSELQVSLSKTGEGFGFALRGAKINPNTLSIAAGQENNNNLLAETLLAANNLMSLQYLDEIEPGSVAEQAGLKRGDYLLAVNQHDVRSYSHEQVVRLIRQSGDNVHLTVATPSRKSPSPPPPPPPLAASLYGNSRTLGRVKPEPPKRDPNTTLTRNRGQRVKSMLIQPIQRYQDPVASDTSSLFDANKPLPQAPVSATSPMSPTGSLNLMAHSMSSNLSHFNSAQSLTVGSGGGAVAAPQSLPSDAQSISSISTLAADQVSEQQQVSLQPLELADTSQQATPTHSSSSTATLTTVAAVKPKAPPKPGISVQPQQQQHQQPVYRPAVITTSRRVSQVATGSPPSPSQVSAVERHPTRPPTPPPPPPPPLSPLRISQVAAKVTTTSRLDQRRTSAPVNNLKPVVPLVDSSRLQKKRESLAAVSQVDRPAAQFGSVAAACAAVANNRIQRQQQQQQQLQKQQQQEKQSEMQPPKQPEQQEALPDQQEQVQQQRLEQHRLEQQRIEKQKLEQQLLEQQRLEQKRLEQQQQQHQEKVRLEQQRQEQLRLEQQRKERLEQQQQHLKQIQQQQLIQQQQQQQQQLLIQRQQQQLLLQQQQARQPQLLLQQQQQQQQQHLVSQPQRTCIHQASHEHHHARTYSDAPTSATSGAARGHHLHHQHQVQVQVQQPPPPPIQQQQRQPAQVIVSSNKSHAHHHHSHHHHHRQQLQAAQHHNHLHNHYAHQVHHHNHGHHHHGHSNSATNAIQQQQQQHHHHHLHQQQQQQQQQYHQQYVPLNGIDLYDCQSAAISTKRSAY